MISKITEEMGSLSIAPSKELEKVASQETSMSKEVQKKTPTKNTPKSQRRKSKGASEPEFQPQQYDDNNIAVVNSEKESYSSCSVTQSQDFNIVPLPIKYKGLVARKRKMLSRQEMRALKAAEAKASLQNADQTAVELGLPSSNGDTPSRACSTPTDQAARNCKQVKFAVEDSPVISEGKAYRTSMTVARSIQLYCSVSKKWTTSKKEGAVNLQNFVALKIDKDGNLAKALDYTAMIYLSDFSDVLKSMSAMCDSLEESFKSIIDLKLKKEASKTFKPFNGVPFITIVKTLHDICKGYNTEYNYKRGACTKLMNACFHEDDKEDCTQQLNNIVNIWTTDVHITGKDPRLEMFCEEMVAFGCI